MIWRYWHARAKRKGIKGVCSHNTVNFVPVPPCRPYHVVPSRCLRRPSLVRFVTPPFQPVHKHGFHPRACVTLLQGMGCSVLLLVFLHRVAAGAGAAGAIHSLHQTKGICVPGIHVHRFACQQRLLRARLAAGKHGHLQLSPAPCSPDHEGSPPQLAARTSPRMPRQRRG